MADHDGSSVADSAKKGKTPRKTPGSTRRGGDVDAQLKRLEDKIARRDSKIELLKSQLVQVKKREVMLVQEVQRTRELAAESAAQTSNQFMKMKTSLAATHERERMLREQLDTLRSQAPSTCASSIAPSPDRLGFSPFAPAQNDQKVKKLEEQLAEEKHRREIAEQKLAERPEPVPTPVVEPVPAEPVPAVQPAREDFLARIKDAISETVFPVVEKHTADPVDFDALVVSLAALLDRSSNASLPYPQDNHNNATMVDNTELPEDKACLVPDVTPPTVPESVPSTEMTPPVRAADSSGLYNDEPEVLPVSTQPEAAQAEVAGEAADAAVEGWGDDAQLDLGEAEGHEESQQVEQTEDGVGAQEGTEEAPVEVSGDAEEGTHLGEYQEEQQTETQQPDYTAYYHGDWVRLFDSNHDPPHPYFMNLITHEASWEQPEVFDWSQALVYEAPPETHDQGVEMVETGEVPVQEPVEQEERQPEGEREMQESGQEEGERQHEEEEEAQKPVVQEEGDRQPEEEEVVQEDVEKQPEGEAQEPVSQEEEEVQEPVTTVQEVARDEDASSPSHQGEGEVMWPVGDARQAPLSTDEDPHTKAELDAVREEIRNLLPENTTIEDFLGSYKTQYEKRLLQQRAKERESENEKPPREQSVENSDIPTFSQDFLSGNCQEMNLNMTFEAS